jgi:hypothetical protein
LGLGGDEGEKEKTGEVMLTDDIRLAKVSRVFLWCALLVNDYGAIKEA